MNRREAIKTAVAAVAGAALGVVPQTPRIVVGCDVGVDGSVTYAVVSRGPVFVTLPNVSQRYTFRVYRTFYDTMAGSPASLAGLK